MKLVIYTQYVENYGDVDKPFWKFKGGDTYIVPNLTAEQGQRILRDGIPTLKALIEYKNPMSEVSISNYAILEDDVVVCDEWETPYILSWENNTWVGRIITLNDGMYRKPIVSKVSKFTLAMNGERNDFEVTFVIESGQLVGEDSISDYFQADLQA
jgi:hypothetical protein